MSGAAELLLGKERAIMQFAYEGFTHRGDNRYFRFRCMLGRDSVDLYSIEIETGPLLEICCSYPGRADAMPADVGSGVLCAAVRPQSDFTAIAL